jgi:hypothetical protein
MPQTGTEFVGKILTLSTKIAIGVYQKLSSLKSHTKILLAEDHEDVSF